MRNLNEHINRIRGMMKMIQESDFNIADQLPNKNPDQSKWELHSIIMYVMASFSDDPLFYDEDIDLSQGSFSITDNAGEYLLYYEFDVKINSHGSYDPGDYETPPYYEGAEWEYKNMKLTIYDYTSGLEKIVYSGPDISDFENMKFTPKAKDYILTGVDLIYRAFDDKINELIADDEPDYPEPDYD